MTPADKLLEKLSSLPASGPVHVDAEAGGWKVDLSLQKQDAVGALVNEASVTRTTPAPEGATLRGWAESVASHKAGLLENLKLLEVDEVRGQAMIRSDEPSAKGDEVRYYEVVITGTEKADVKRYKGDRTGETKREAIPFAMTHEALARLVDGITE